MFLITEILNKRGTDLIGKALSSFKLSLAPLTLLLALVLCSKPASAKHRLMALNSAQLLQLAQGAGFSGNDAQTMAAIIKAESSGNPYAHNTNRATGDNSYGLSQINMIDALGPARRKQFGLKSNEQLLDPQTNLRAAKQVKDSSGFGAWTTFKSGKYKQFLPELQKTAA